MLPGCGRGRRRTRRRRRSPRTSRRSSRRSARRVTGPIRWRRCRSMTYAEARPWARSIKARVADRQMPPWQIDRDRRHPEVQERPVADRRPDRHHRPLGRRRRAAGRPEGHAAPPSSGPSDQGWNFAAAFGQTEPDLVIKSHDFTMPAVSQDVWDKRVTPIGHHRAALGARDRDPARDAEGPQDHASRHRLPRAGRAGRRRRRRACPRRSWNGRSASRAR